MPLIKCPMCEKDISPNAISCPNCGEPMKNKLDSKITFNEEDICNFILINSGKDTIRVIKQVRDTTGWSLYDSKKSVENAPSIIYEKIKYAEALSYKSAYEELGAKVEIVSADKGIIDYVNTTNIGFIIKCPNCNSTNTKKISGASKVGSAVMFGVFAMGKLTKTYQCNKCGYKW